MSTRSRIDAVPDASPRTTPKPAPRLSRDIVLALIVVAILLAGIGAGGALPPEPEAPEITPQRIVVRRNADLANSPARPALEEERARAVSRRE